MDPNTGWSRPFGFILFKDAASVEKVLEQKQHWWDGCIIDHKRTIAMKKNQVKKILWGVLNTKATEKIREYFHELGEMEAMSFP